MEAQMSAFRFIEYRIKKSLIEINGDPKCRNIGVDFIPSGTIYYNESKFVLTLQTNIMDDKGELKIEVLSEGVFEFKNNTAEKDLDGFFYTNASAILFPYIRAYIATLTTLSGEPIVMPTMNLINLRDELRKNTVEK